MPNARRKLRDEIVAALEEVPEIKEREIPVARHREPQRDKTYVWLWKTTGEREYKVLGPNPSPNEEKIEALLRVVAIRVDEADAEDSAEELAEIVEAALRQLDLPGPPFIQNLLIKKVDDEPLDFDGKVGHHVLMTVSTQARI